MTNYFATFWLGQRRFPDRRTRTDPLFHLRDHAEWLRRVRHRLDRIVFILAVERAVEIGPVLEAVGQLPNLSFLVRHNIGLSYGGFADAFALYPNDQHYILTEDDVMFVEDDFDSTLQTWLDEDPQTGCLCATVGVGDPHPGNLVGIYRGDCLRRIVEQSGSLPFSPTGCSEFSRPGEPNGDYSAHEQNGQVALGRAITAAGYRIRDWTDRRFAPFWNQAKIRPFGEEAAPVFAMTSHLTGGPVDVEGQGMRIYDVAARRFR